MKNKLRLLRMIVLITISTAISASALAQSTEKKEGEKSTLEEFVGEYIYDNKASFGFDINISFDEEAGLQAQPTDQSQPKADMMGLEKDQFELARTGGLVIMFWRDDKGEIISLTMSDGDREFTCLRKKED